MNIDNIQETIRSFRYTLPANSRTAHAIDQRASLEEISECAEEEGLHGLASLLFGVQQEALNETTEIDMRVHTSEAVREFRQHLPANSKTADAIDRGASWDMVSKLAEEEGLRQSQLATVLFEAQQEHLRAHT